MKLNQKFIAVEDELNKGLIERSAPIRGVLLSALSSTNLLLLGPAGIAKSMLINEWNKRITGSAYFEWLLSKFSTPDELFGPISLTGLETEHYRRVTVGKLPEANTAFLDEIFKANSSILNALLTILNERKFYNDGKPIIVPLVTVAGASNEIPDSEDGLDAFFDRFLLKYHLQPIHEPSAFIKMLKLAQTEPSATISLEDIHAAQLEVDKVTVDDAILSQVVKIRETVRREITAVSDRTFKISIKILKAEAWLNGKSEVLMDNLEVYRHICWTKPEQEKSIHSSILQLISPEKNKILEYYHAVLEMEKELYKKREAGGKQTAVVETSQKVNEACVRIADLKKAMVARKQDVKEIEKIEGELEEIKIRIARDILGVDITKLRQHA
jgi:MoxR-like ATPase